MVQFPIDRVVSTPAVVIVQMDGVSELKVTARPELAEAVRVGVAPNG